MFQREMRCQKIKLNHFKKNVSKGNEVSEKKVELEKNEDEKKF